jgi:hypothetical protein
VLSKAKEKDQKILKMQKKGFERQMQELNQKINEFEN